MGKDVYGQRRMVAASKNMSAMENRQLVSLLMTSFCDDVEIVIVVNIHSTIDTTSFEKTSVVLEANFHSHQRYVSLN